jgi:acetylornithine deacetylase/succinyl-diaminopimelate desuccinylase-like protein
MLVSLEEFNRVHGIDERVSVDSMLEGIQVYTDMVKKLCRT